MTKTLRDVGLHACALFAQAYEAPELGPVPASAAMALHNQILDKAREGTTFSREQTETMMEAICHKDDDVPEWGNEAMDAMLLREPDTTPEQ